MDIISVPLNSRIMTASGFLATNGTSVWLVTCAHILTGQRHFLTDWIKWEKFLNIYIDSSSSFKLNLFDQANKPIFCWTHEKIKGYAVEDIISYKLENLHLEKLHRYKKFDISNIYKPNSSDALSFFGYPGFGQSFPAVPAERSKKGIVVATGLQYIKLNTGSENGFSGGPVLYKDRLVGVMSGNSGESACSALIVQISGIDNKIFAP